MPQRSENLLESILPLYNLTTKAFSVEIEE